MNAHVRAEEGAGIAQGAADSHHSQMADHVASSVANASERLVGEDLEFEQKFYDQYKIT